jgi:hypothetical protein
LENLNCGSALLTSLPTLPAGLKNLFVNNNLLTRAAVDAALVRLAAGSISNGFCDVGTGANAAPSAVGLAAKATLQSRNWIVFNN